MPVVKKPAAAKPSCPKQNTRVAPKQKRSPILKKPAAAAKTVKSEDKLDGGAVQVKTQAELLQDARAKLALLKGPAIPLPPPLEPKPDADDEDDDNVDGEALSEMEAKAVAAEEAAKKQEATNKSNVAATDSVAANAAARAILDAADKPCLETYGGNCPQAARLELAASSTTVRDKEYATFKRWIVSKKHPRHPVLKSKWEEAVNDKGYAAKSRLFYEFFAAGGDEQTMVMSIKRWKSDILETIDEHAWLSLSELEKSTGQSRPWSSHSRRPGKGLSNQTRTSPATSHSNSSGASIKAGKRGSRLRANHYPAAQKWMSTETWVPSFLMPSRNRRQRNLLCSISRLQVRRRLLVCLRLVLLSQVMCLRLVLVSRLKKP